MILRVGKDGVVAHGTDHLRFNLELTYDQANDIAHAMSWLLDNYPFKEGKESWRNDFERSTIQQLHDELWEPLHEIDSDYD
jgi:hypothetical protein